jgi:hypothetical protein
MTAEAMLACSDWGARPTLMDQARSDVSSEAKGRTA